VALDPEELDKIACWIDLFVPYCGDYLEANAWADQERQLYQHFADKRRRMQSLEAEAIQDLLRSTQTRGDAMPSGGMGMGRWRGPR
jgi:hypothetical protein